MKKFKVLNRFGACLAGLLAATAVCAALPESFNANANSGPTHWNGVTASGTVFTGENCPIEAESEVLTFNIQQFIDHGSDKEELINYGANFSAEYTFKNPTDSEVNATLAFPLGADSDFGYWEKGEGGANDTYIKLDDLNKDKCKVFIDGVETSVQTRRAFHKFNGFDFASESTQIKDGLRAHEFFTPDMPVYKYTFRIVSEKDGYFEGEATVGNCDNLRLAGSYGSLETEKGKTVVSYSLEDGREVELYSIGGELDAGAVEWRFFERSGYLNLAEKKVEATAVLSPKVDETSFKEYVFKGYSGGNELSPTEEGDFYNAVLDYIDEYLQTSMLPAKYSFLQDSDYLMRWLVYDLHFGAGQTVKNTVTAPLYSGGRYDYTPYVYTYDYLLSPAQKWNGFNSLEIRINTPYYLINSNLPFEKTEYGYCYHDDGLPDGELEFWLCEVENPEHKENYGYVVFAVILLILAVACFAVPLAVIIIFIVWVVKRSKKGNSEAVKSGVNGFKPMNTFGGGSGGSADGNKGGADGNADGNSGAN